MQGHLLALGPDQMVHDVAARGVAATIAEPFLVVVAHEHRGWIMNATVPAMCEIDVKKLDLVPLYQWIEVNPKEVTLC